MFGIPIHYLHLAFVVWFAFDLGLGVGRRERRQWVETWSPWSRICIRCQGIGPDQQTTQTAQHPAEHSDTGPGKASEPR